MKKILIITNFNGVLSAICEKGEPIPIADIKGNPRMGAMLNDDNEVVGNNVDPDCVGGSCPVK